MNTKQVKIQKKIGEHIAALHSLYEEFERADDSFNDPFAGAKAELAKMPPDKRDRFIKRVIKQVYDKNPAA